MSYTWAINPSTGDLQVNTKGKLQGVYGAEEVRQRILITLQHFYQEYFLNIPGGVPWGELILGSKDVALANALLRRAVLGVPGVLSIISFSSSFSNRALSISMSAQVSGTSGSTYVVHITTSTRDWLFFAFEGGDVINFESGTSISVT